MAKDPAFLFYSSDFLTGTMFMSNEQIGLYVRMLCAQHQHGGRIDTNVLRSQCDGITGGDTVYAKFKHDEKGSYNERLEEEMKKRREKSQKARESVNKRWAKNKYDSNTNVLRFENENENENVDVNRTVKEKKDAKIESEESFDFWWDLYAKKIDAKKCRAKWKKFSRETQRKIMLHTKAYVAATPEIQYRRNPLTYLNSENWNDEQLPQPRQTTKKETIDDVFARLRAPIEEKKDHQALDNRNKYLDLGHENT